jgi:3-hydroxymyristoyl/3-hydroxydecanoyl-(acyl carrier protein) dehydratase
VFTGGDGVHFAVDDAGKATVVASHLPEPIALGDRIELVEPSSPTTSRRIRLLGRDDDLVKVGGKRASLAGLTATLRSLPGVVDGAFFFPTDDAKRLCAVVVAPGASPLQIRTALAAAIDGAFLPRPLVLVDAIPRTASHKVPLASLRELLASHKQPDTAFVADARFDRADPVFAGHFPGRPIVPGVLLIERVEAVLAQRGRRMVEVSSVKFHAAASPEETLGISVACDASGDARFEIVRDATLVASGVCRTVSA